MNREPEIHSPRHRHIAMLAFEGCEILDICGPLEVFGMANIWLKLSGQAEEPAYSLSVLAEQAGPITTMSGLRIVADRAIGEADDRIDTFLVAGGLGVEAARKNPVLLVFLTRMAGRVRRLGSICTGAFLLAESGLLDGRRATTHWYWCRQLADEYPSITVEPDRIAVRDGSVYSSGGVTAGIDLALSLIEEDWGRETAVMIGRWMLVFPSRPGGQSQFSNCLVKGSGARRDFRELQDWIIAHPGEDLGIEALACRVNMSPRHFSRLFYQEVGLTPAKFVELARLERARAQLEQTLLPVEIIAGQSGFGTPEHMRRAFQRTLKVSPQDYRARFRSIGHDSKPRDESVMDLIS
jgi:transcriptional regulator GlxA family with amidase domain